MDTPFPEAVRVEPVAGSESLFTANVPKDWCGTPAAHGGYLQSLIFSAARTYFQTHHPARNQPDPISSHTQFIKQVWSGPVTLSIKPVNIGSRVSVIRIELSQSTHYSVSQKSKSDSNTTTESNLGIIATVTQSNLAKERGLSLRTVPSLKKDEVPDREEDCEVIPHLPFWKVTAPVVFKLSSKRVKGGVDGTFSDHHGRSVREMWCSLTDGSNFDVLSLGFLTDGFGGAPNNYASNNIDYQQGAAYPTLSMATEIKKDPKDSKWLFMKIRSHEIKNGRFDTEVTVVDEAGSLVAMSKHVSLAIVRQSPEEMKNLYRL